MLHAVTCLFNPSGYRTKATNFAVFRAALAAQGVPLLTVDCAFGDEPFALPAAADVIHVRARDVMWQKERLLNLAVVALPPDCTKLAWLDADILFANPRWAEETERLLDRFAVAQPFARVVRLPRGHPRHLGAGDRWRSAGHVYARQPNLLLSGDFAAHGHTGFAWAARRDWVAAHGLYDACVAGSGDHMMAHAFAGDWSSRCIERILGPAPGNAHRAWFETWCRRVYPSIRAGIGVTPGEIHHLWHGETARRRYVLRNRELADFQFDPAADLRLGPSGAWEWSAAGGRLRAWAVDYFDQREEDE